MKDNNFIEQLRITVNNPYISTTQQKFILELFKHYPELYINVLIFQSLPGTFAYRKEYLDIKPCHKNIIDALNNEESLLSFGPRSFNYTNLFCGLALYVSNVLQKNVLIKTGNIYKTKLFIRKCNDIAEPKFIKRFQNADDIKRSTLICNNIHGKKMPDTEYYLTIYDDYNKPYDCHDNLYIGKIGPYTKNIKTIMKDFSENIYVPSYNELFEGDCTTFIKYLQSIEAALHFDEKVIKKEIFMMVDGKPNRFTESIPKEVMDKYCQILNK